MDWEMFKAVGVWVSPLYLIIVWLLKFTTNHITTLVEKVARIEAKLGINNEKEEK